MKLNVLIKLSAFKFRETEELSVLVVVPFYLQRVMDFSCFKLNESI